jgi:hypothetical protein
MKLRRLLIAVLMLTLVSPTQQVVGQTQGLVAEANVGYHRFGEMGNGPGIDAALMYAWASGLQLGARGEYFFPNTVEEFGELIEWSEVGVFGEVRYRFSPSRPSGPYVAALVGGQWFTIEFQEPGGFKGTEGDLSSGVAAGYDFALSDRLWVTASVLASLGDEPEYEKNRVALRLGAKYAFASD